MEELAYQAINTFCLDNKASSVWTDYSSLQASDQQGGRFSYYSYPQ